MAHTIQSGYRSFKTLPRATFGTLQSRLTPLYFSFTSLSTAALLVAHLYFHPSLISTPLVRPHWHSSQEGVQGLLIVGALVPSLVNWLYAGPKATEVMFERHRLEKLEGKSYDDAQVCRLCMVPTGYERGVREMAGEVEDGCSQRRGRSERQIVDGASIFDTISANDTYLALCLCVGMTAGKDGWSSYALPRK